MFLWKIRNKNICCGTHRGTSNKNPQYMFLLSHLLVAGCDIGIRFSVRPSVNIYVDVRH